MSFVSAPPARYVLVGFAWGALACPARPPAVASADAPSSRVSAPPRPPRADAPALLVPPRFAEVGGACSVGEHIVVGESFAALRVYDVAVAANTRGALVVWRTGEDEVTARALDAGGRPRGDVRATSLARGSILRLIAQPDGTFVAVANPFCPPGANAHDQCVAARTFGPDGAPREPVDTTNVGPRDLGYPWAEEGPRGAVALLEPSLLDSGTPSLLGLVPHDGAAATLAITPLSVSLPAGEDARLRGFAVDPEGRAVVLLRSTEGDVLVREGDAPRSVAGLPRVRRAALALEGDVVLAAIASPAPRRRVEVVRLGRLAATAATRVDGAPLPAPFDAVSIRVDVGMGGCLHVERSVPGWGALDGAITHVWDCRDSDRPPAGRGVAWTGRRFLVAHARHAEGRWRVRVTPVTCAAP